MNDQAPNPKRPDFDLAQRTALFGEAVIAFAKRLPRGPVNDSIIDQVVRSGTSVGANYCEADDADSKKDFRYKIGVCRREAKETRYWLRMAAASEELLREDARKLWKEANELVLVFAKIGRSSR